MTVKQLEDIHNFKQEGDESLYQAWERYNDMLYKCPTHDINNHQKVNIFYKGLSTMNRQLLDSQGPILGMTPAQALTTIQTMADHSQKWHDGTTSRNIGSSSSKDGLAALVNKLDNLGRDMKKLKESVHAIQVGCQICEGPHLDKDCPLNEEVKQVEEIDNRPPYGEKRQSLEELLAKHQEEFAREVLKWRVMSPSKRKFRWGIMRSTGIKCYIDPISGCKIWRTNRKCRIPIDLYPCKVEESMTMKKVGDQTIEVIRRRRIDKEGNASRFQEYHTADEEE
ncbi:hypothetical protein Tco_0599082 [Tanacetum coccineum]